MRHHPLTRRIFTFGLIAMFAGFAFFAAAPAYALTIVPECARVTRANPPSLACALLTFTNVASLIVGVTGSFALLMFVYGGFMMITSGGVEARVTLGKTILKNALIGIVLIFTAGYIIDYAVGRLRGGASTASTVAGTCDSVRGEGFTCMDPALGSDCTASLSCPNTAQQCCIPAATVCLGGTNAGASCNTDSDCPAAPCAAGTTCVPTDRCGAPTAP